MNKTALLVSVVAVAVLATFVAFKPEQPTAPPPFDHVVHCDFASQLSVTCWRSEEQGRWTYGSEPGTFKYLTWTRYTECFNNLYRRSYKEIARNKPHALSGCYPSPFTGVPESEQSEKDEDEEEGPSRPGNDSPVDPGPVPEPTVKPVVEPTPRPAPAPTKAPGYPVNPHEPEEYRGEFTWTQPYEHHTDPNEGEDHPVWGKTRCVDYKGGYVHKVYVGKVENGRAAGC